MQDNWDLEIKNWEILVGHVELATINNLKIKLDEMIVKQVIDQRPILWEALDYRNERQDISG